MTKEELAEKIVDAMDLDTLMQIVYEDILTGFDDEELFEVELERWKDD